MFGAGLVVVLNRTLRLLGIRWPARIALLALFALNPMIAFYATNGMTEIAYLFFLMTGIHFLLRWYLSRDSHFLVLASVPFAQATLTRYELVGYAALAAITIAFVMRRHIEDSKLESSMIGFLVPIVYGFGLWMFFNGLIMHDPLFWFKNQFPSAGGTVTGINALTPTLTLSPAALLSSWRHSISNCFRLR